LIAGLAAAFYALRRPGVRLALERFAATSRFTLEKILNSVSLKRQDL
jgi:hypothetical protein